MTKVGAFLVFISKKEKRGEKSKKKKTHSEEQINGPCADDVSSIKTHRSDLEGVQEAWKLQPMIRGIKAKDFY